MTTTPLLDTATAVTQSPITAGHHGCMSPMIVGCGCGRQMTLDALRGKGAYRCGCGARVVISIPQDVRRQQCTFTECTWVAATGPLRVCAEHKATAILAVLPETYAAYPPHRWLEASTKYRDAFGEPPPIPAWIGDPNAPRIPESHAAHAPLVYFIAVGDRVKIGTTTNLTKRIGGLGLPGDAVVAATMPGSYDEERRLHSRFTDERIGGSEWFTLSDRLRAFIESKKNTPATSPSPRS